MLRKHVVIVGGGWGGIALARKLKKISTDKIRITLVSDQANFRYSPAMYRVATGHREKETIIPISDLTADITSLKFIKAKAGHIDRAKKILHLSGSRQLHYDYLVIAVGTVTNYFGIDGLKEHSFDIKNPRSLHKFRGHLHQTLINAHQPDKNYVIVGGGPTGVELAAALGSYMKKVVKRHGIGRRSVNVELIEAAPKLIPQSHQKASFAVLARLRHLGIKVHLKSKVESESADFLRYNGKSLPTKTVIWTAGTTNNPLFKEHGNIFPLNEQGFVLVDSHLRADPYLYVIGDNAASQYRGLAFTAVQHAKYVAKDLSLRLNGEVNTPAYRPKSPPTVIPVGQNWAVFQYKAVVVYGFVGSLFRIAADLVGYRDITGLSKGTKYWLRSSYKEERCYVCRTSIKHEDALTQLSYH